jgi:hypothetical protein
MRPQKADTDLGQSTLETEGHETFSNVATETEAKEILVQASQFYGEVEDWITKNHPSLKI